jgi:indolepyruvate ferredoxin oxidoreductase, beta subunit
MKAAPELQLDKPLTVAILAMGGQGGGVLTDWIVAVAEASGWHAQSTSVPGVAQRTGATIYYIEMLPPRDGKAPVLSLMPTPGDVDVVIAAELMEAGRSILRGLATPDKTLLITSTHRSYAIVEKEKPGEAIGDPQAVRAAAGIAAQRIIAFDMEDMARQHGTVVSSPILGALAGAGALPFARDTFEQAIRASGKGVNASLNGFAAGFSLATVNQLPHLRVEPEKHFEALASTLGAPELDQLLARLHALPRTAQAMALAGLKRVIDFQDVAYGAEYLDRLEALAVRDEKAGGSGHSHAFTMAAAKYLANAMAYDDVIGVADLKTRASRFIRISKEMNAADDPMYVTEFMHPRAEEIVSLLPRRLGRWVSSRERLMSRLDWLVNRGRYVQTAKLGGFLQLYAVSSLRRFRRGLLRHHNEITHIESWISRATHVLPENYGLARGVLSARRLIKGYSDTHARGLSKFDKVMSVIPVLQPRHDAAEWMDRLISAALKDEDGKALDGAIKTIQSF